jgi:hypothetical protein
MIILANDEAALRGFVPRIIDIDAIVHELSELLGDPHLLAAPVLSADTTLEHDAASQRRFGAAGLALNPTAGPGGAQ